MPAHSESNLAFLSIEQAARLLRKKEISPVDLVETALARIERFNPRINAFITVVADRARHNARLAEKQIRQGRAPEPSLRDPDFDQGQFLDTRYSHHRWFHNPLGFRSRCR